MKRYIFTLLLLVGLNVSGQKNYELSAPVNTSKTYIARDYIRLLPGFSFSSTGKNTLYLGIDEHILAPASYLSLSKIPNPNRSINTKYVVGAIAGEASASPTGAAIYQIPIEVMPGTGGVQPNISVVYNSQSGNGLVGYGWSLNAISAITRVGKTIYHDGSTAVPDSTNSDNLMLDGQRLIRASGNNLLASSTYKTEIETYLDITCKTLNSYLGFEVKNKEGWTLEYGSSADSYIKPKDSSFAYAWLLKKATDANGNYMTYTYVNDASTGEFRLKQIDYTGNSTAGLNPYNKVEFFYETRNDKSTSYIAGKSVEQSVILTRIKCSAYDSTIREYKLIYYYDGFYSKLTEVEEYGQNNIRYNSTIVDWGDYYGVNAKNEGEYQSFFSPNKEGIYPLYADFNEDGKTDFLAYPEKNSYTNSDVATLFLSHNLYGDVYFYKQCTIPLISGFVKFLPADLNGDGFVDIVRICKVANNNYRYDYFIFNGTSFSASGGFNSASDEALSGDFNGDGKYEILTKSESKLYNQSGTAIATGGITWGTRYYDELPYDQNLIDFNGNGKTDLLVMDASGFRVYELNGSSFSLLSSGTDLKNTSSVKYSPLIGDFNGDGKTDILVNCNDNDYYILFSTGTGFKKKTLPNLNVTGKWFACDFNKDGKTDIVFCAQNNGYGFPLKIGLFDGETFQFESYTSKLITSSNMNMSLSWEYLHFSDFDGDGYPELCFSGWSDAAIIKSFNSKQNLFVRTIINGMNQKISFQYKPITEDGYYTETATSYSFPVTKFRQPLYVVTAINTANGSFYSDNSFFYKNARLHRQGKGFLGFEEIKAINDPQDRNVVTQYGYNSTYYNVYPVKQTVTTTSGDSISQTNIVNDYYSTSVSKVIFPYISSQTTVDKLTGISKKTENAYTSSDDGNPNKLTETQGSLITETSYTWEKKGSSSFKNRVTQQVVNKKGIGTTFAETKKFEYDTKARLTKKIDYSGNAKAITTGYSSYDNFGNTRKVTTTATNCPIVTDSSLYDATGRFIETHIDVLGNVSKARYDATTGVLLENTDIAGLKTAYQYDGFQKPLKETTPTDDINYSTTWDISGNSVYKTVVISKISGTQTTWYNAVGLDTKTQLPGFSGTVVSEKEYDYKGQLYRSYLPGYGSKGSQYVEYGYDSYGRINKEINIGRTTTYNYNGLTTTVTAPNGTSRSTTLNLSGLVENSKDEAGNAVAYTYNSLGKPETITASGDTTYIKYDDRGFQRVLKDVNMTDSVKYVYDAYGQLTSQTNARGQATSFQYDAAGRITQELCPERTLTYQYVPSGNGIGQIQTIKQDNAIIRSYGYTPLGQLSSLTEKIDNADYTTSYSYNALGQIQEKQSPSGMRTSYQYNGNGLLTSMRNAENNTLLWQLDAANAMGQITESTSGNGLKRVSGYDAYYSPNQILLKNGTSIIDQVNYNFNATTGNLTSRNDVSNTRNEVYGYDNLNRLTSITLNGGTANSIAYRPNGNINTKFDVGTYQYDNGNHAVSGITNKLSSYNPPALDINNTSYNKVSSLTQQGSIIKKLDFQYNTDNQRNKSLYYENGVLKKTMYYAGNYEKEAISGGSTKEYDYIYTPEGLSAVAIKTNGTRSFYYVQSDHLGSIRVVTTAAKAIQTRYYYDAWGKQTLASGTSITNRGYIGEEHLNEFGLLNLNARIYDPVLGRFLEMDPYVQMPDFTQSHNRYSYCLNNPLKYTDPDGEWFGIDDLIAAAAGFVFGYVGYGISTGNWGWKAVGAGGMGAAMAWVGYNTAGLSTAAWSPGQGVTSATWNYVGSMAINTVANQIIPPMNIPIGDHFALGVSPMFGLGASGLTGGIGLSAIYSNGDLSIGAGIGAGDNYWGWNSAATYAGWGGGYGQTTYGSAEVMGQQFAPQRVGTYTGYFNHNSFSISNDLWGDKGDRQRTSAVELTIGKFSVGTYLYTNDGRAASADAPELTNGLGLDNSPNCVPPAPVGLKKSGKRETWWNGRPYSAPFWVGYRNGNQITRIGFSHEIVHNLTQNMVHKFMSTPYYMMYDEFRTGGYFYTGAYNPFSLWDK